MVRIFFSSKSYHSVSSSSALILWLLRSFKDFTHTAKPAANAPIIVAIAVAADVISIAVYIFLLDS